MTAICTVGIRLETIEKTGDAWGLCMINRLK